MRTTKLQLYFKKYRDFKDFFQLQYPTLKLASRLFEILAAVKIHKLEAAVHNH